MPSMAAPSAFLVFLLSLCAIRVHGLPQAPEGDPITAVQGLVERVLGKGAVTKFEFEVIAADHDSSGRDVFEIDFNGTKPVLRGNTGVAIASGLNHYLKYWCNCSVTWGRNGTGDQVRLPSPLPLPKGTVRIVSPVKYRYWLAHGSIDIEFFTPPSPVGTIRMCVLYPTPWYGGTLNAGRER